ncbi:hypothetical protein [Flavobacterium xinjiangense]|uniref:Uncharacterized protein n=1 Tax=Flavobacterium xinjiangense TaxID=178356 RepID=A0A1M7J3Q6_9FLAO|nr:hypothetical protein [Flavobacterium xinjiangense]SHM47523.1 hypothetical protein SAMN05216269_104308 [Flavobacterium xinjiangense]
MAFVKDAIFFWIYSVPKRRDCSGAIPAIRYNLYITEKADKTDFHFYLA